MSLEQFAPLAGAFATAAGALLAAYGLGWLAVRLLRGRREKGG
jgi:hypothetical protein